jgi:glycosyltransferase involved in cell wall biosynthesis
MTLDYPRRLTRWAFLFADRVLRPTTKRYIAVCGHLKEQLLRSGIASGKVMVIYNGVSVAGRPQRSDAAAAAQDSGEARGQSHSGLRLVSMGRLHPVKNFDGLIAAMRLLPDDTSLDIWGDGAQRAELVSLIAEMGLEQRVKLRGESQSMTQALADADVYIQPSRSEGCSFTVAEAMLHGKPVVVTPCGGLPEQVDDGHSGLVAGGTTPEDLAAAISVLVTDTRLTARLGEAGRNTAQEKFSMEAWLQATVAAFLEAAGTSRGYARRAS